ncbi:MAG TPA: type II toxin-antitoxin system HicA family toxin [Terriglobia bacterium]|nr:type II toxin-antitoxin system HicA family toxin [Terriglobia bacterium]
MKSVSGKELARALERHGWQLLRIHGSHHIYGKLGSIIRLSVPVHGNKPLKTGYSGTCSRRLKLKKQLFDHPTHC